MREWLILSLAKVLGVPVDVRREPHIFTKCGTYTVDQVHRIESGGTAGNQSMVAVQVCGGDGGYGVKPQTKT